jgi:hypothetical protein
MPTKKTAVERLEQIVEEHPHSPASTRVSLTLGEVRDLRAKLAMLTDGVVGAAALYFGELDSRDEPYASEELCQMALDLVKTTPRLKGAFKGGA